MIDIKGRLKNNFQTAFIYYLVMGILNGFIACRSDEILPEFFIKETDKVKQYPEHGSVIWAVEDGVRRKAAVFDDEKMKFVPADEHDRRN